MMKYLTPEMEIVEYDESVLTMEEFSQPDDDDDWGIIF